MLSETDRQWIKGNRKEIVEGRTDKITLLKTVCDGKDPITGEPIEKQVPIEVEAIWKDYSTVSNTDRSVIGGVELQKGDVKITFSIDVDLTDVKQVYKTEGDLYEILTIDEKGLGLLNRSECLARKVT